MAKRGYHFNHVVLGGDGSEELPLLNNQVLQTVVGSLLRESVDRIPQPILIIGAEGGGKTHMMLRIAETIRKRGANLVPMLIEGKSLFRMGDLTSMNVSSTAQPVWLVDNIQYLFMRTENSERFALRGMLNKPGAPILVGTSEKVQSYFTAYEEAFFDGFKISYLLPPTEQEMGEIVGGTHVARMKCVLSLLPPTPRAAYITKKVLEASLGKSEDIPILIDMVHDRYLLRFDRFTTQQQRILLILSGYPQGAPLATIREVTGDTGGQLSPYLKKLCDQGVLKKKQDSKERGSYYVIVDPLLGMWLKRNITNNLA